MGFNFGETGRLAEELLGGGSVKPTNNPELVVSMAQNNELCSPQTANNPRFKEQLFNLPRGIQILLDLAEQHGKSRSREGQAEIRKKMIQVKRKFDHKLLQEALIRYTINAHDNSYLPSAPGPLYGGKGRNEFIGELAEQLAEDYDTDLDNIEFYNAADTPLDILYSTDGFFVLDGRLFGDNEKRVVPIDVTISRSKESKYQNPSGSLILYLNPEELDDERLEKYRDEFSQQIKQAADTIGIDHALDDFQSKFDRGKAA